MEDFILSNEFRRRRAVQVRNRIHGKPPHLVVVSCCISLEKKNVLEHSMQKMQQWVQDFVSESVFSQSATLNLKERQRKLKVRACEKATWYSWLWQFSSSDNIFYCWWTKTIPYMMIFNVHLWAKQFRNCVLEERDPISRFVLAPKKVIHRLLLVA